MILHVIYILRELKLPFNIIAVLKTTITDNILHFNQNIPKYNFEFVQTPLSAGGVEMYVRWDNEIYGYWKNVSIEAFQSLWIELQFTKQSNIIWGVIYRQHNAAKRFLDSFEEAVDHYSTTGKPICLLGDISINVLRAQTCDYAQQFLNCLPSYAFLKAIDMPTRVYNNLGGGGGEYSLTRG